MKNNNLLIVDDEVKLVASLERVFRKQPFTLFTANSANEGIEIVKNNDIGVVVSDLIMPETDGLAFFEELGKISEHSVQILMTGHATIESAISAINRLQLFSYITKPWNNDDLIHCIRNAFDSYHLKLENHRLQKLTEEQAMELKEFNDELENRIRLRTFMLEEAIHEGIIMLATAAESRDQCSGNHIHRILELTHDICIEMGLSPEEAFKISSFSMIHDLGKLNVPEEILNKRGVLNGEEWDRMKTHTVEGEKILGDKPFYDIARKIARSHHENWDGTGYPDGLTGRKIPLPARIVAVVDVFDALTNARPYKEALPLERTIKMMKDLSGKKFDPDVLEAFLNVLKKNKVH